MAITNQDLLFQKSERMTDFDDGGGRMSKNEVVDGQMNNVFDDIPDLSAILGNVSLRKLFLHVNTANTDPFLGSFVFLTQPPADPLVECILFNTKSATDERLGAQSYVENYRVKASKTGFVLYSNHLAGQSTIQLFCNPDVATPDLGTVICLSIERAGYTPAEQYLQVEKVLSRQTFTFEDDSGTFTKDVLQIKVTTPLGQDFPGQDDPVRKVLSITSPTVIRATNVADSAAYFSVKPLAVDADEGDLVVKVETPYVQIVPATQAESPIVDQLAGLGTIALTQSGAVDSLSYSGVVSAVPGASVTRYFGTPYKRRSLNATIGAVVLKDDGAGNVVADPPDPAWSGTADYVSGGFSVSRDGGFSGSLSATATPAGAITEQGYSAPLTISAGNRQQSYVFQIPGNPAPGTVRIDYRALGSWIRLKDNGAGVISGEVGQGSGPINYSTGSISVTLGALPDIDSSIILSWGTQIRTKNSSGDLTIPTPVITLNLDTFGIDTDTLVITWESSVGVGKTATVNAAGVVSGDATGSFDAAGSSLQFTTATPAYDSVYSLEYDYVDPSKVHNEQVTPTMSGAIMSFTTAHPIKASSLKVDWWLYYSKTGGTYSPRNYYLHTAAYDDGAGEFLVGDGTVDYATGNVTLLAQ